MSEVYLDNCPFEVDSRQQVIKLLNLCSSHMCWPCKTSR